MRKTMLLAAIVLLLNPFSAFTQVNKVIVPFKSKITIVKNCGRNTGEWMQGGEIWVGGRIHGLGRSVSGRIYQAGDPVTGRER